MAKFGNKVVSLGAPKEAALYYNEVFPFDFCSQTLKITMLSVMLANKNEKYASHVAEFASKETSSIPFDQKGVHFNKEIIRCLMPNLSNAPELYREYLKINTIFHFIMFIRPKGQLKKGAERLVEEIFTDNNEFLIEAGLSPNALRAKIAQKNFSLEKYIWDHIDLYKRLLNKAGFLNSPTWTPSSGFRVPELYPHRGSALHDACQYAIALHDLNLVDVEKVSWDAIIEFRKDADAMSALRDFRLFFEENFSGKDPQYVSDKLQSLLYKQEETAKFWGFETVRKTLSVAASSQNLVGASAITLAPLLAGAPIAIAASAGAVVTLANCALEFGQIYVDERKGRLERPLRYATRLKRISRGK